MDPSIKLHLGRYRRFLWEGPSLLVVLGEFTEVAISKKLYDERHNIKPTSAAVAKGLNRFMGAPMLAVVSRAEREAWGWTGTLPGAESGFFCGIEPEGMVCGRVRSASAEQAAVFLQQQKAGGPLVQSHYEPLSRDPVKAVSRYFKQVEQVPTRIVLDDDCSGVLVQALPDGDFSQVEELPEEKLLELFRQMAGRGELKSLHEVVLFYECRCDDEMILEMITSLPSGQRSELWGSESSLTVECPRCGREYTIQRP
ncbi:hypothetical protein DRQ32_09815 [bacterium]|nr:MAG: hypothetical protein DRQ32_09815 [bacterium]